jgi:membrane-associated protease RseP (regulator of RpoE activity)
MKTTRIVLALLLGLALPRWVHADQKPASTAEAPSGKAVKAVKEVVVPFEILRTGHMTVRVRVNGKGPYKLIFDTGSPVTLLNNKIGRAAGLLGDLPFLGGFGAVGEVKVKELEVGGAKAKEAAAVVMNHPTVEAISKALGPIDGIVGYPFFARYKMTVDYQARTLTFVPNGYRPGNVLQQMQTTIAARMLAPDKPRILAPAGQWGLVAHKEANDDEPGVTLAKVRPGSAAATAGLKAGDRLLTLDGRWTDSVADLYEAARHVKPGTAVPVRIKRDGKEMEIQVKPRAGM